MHTSFDETLPAQIPTESRAVIDRSLLIMEDWAHWFRSGPLRLKERGVVLEDGGSAWAPNRDCAMPRCLSVEARYADRSPIGRPEVIQNVSPARLKQFYTDWYRPDPWR
jgi:zinc protease